MLTEALIHSTYVNDYYSQCIPGTASSSNTMPSTPTTARTTGGMTTVSSASGATTTVAPAAGNPFSGVAPYANPYYASEISTSAIPSLTGAMATKAAAVAKVPTFFWLYASVPFAMQTSANYLAVILLRKFL